MSKFICDSFKLVYRNNIYNKSSAKIFEGRLIRYLEKKLGKIPVAMSGDGCDYWRINLEGYLIDLMVVGTGFNTRIKLKDDESWLLRIRVFTNKKTTLIEMA